MYLNLRSALLSIMHLQQLDCINITYWENSQNNIFGAMLISC